ncbi:KBP-like protein [Ooceraea biroi]|uniref:KIF-binding protein n=1 Tax=Ooceraea biroi TaxID=2015173 RepID=A0A026W7H5_OOCBI|nr:KBP-like protein [Ooceraea biroi]
MQLCHNTLYLQQSHNKPDVLNEGLMWAVPTTSFYIYFLDKYRFSDARNYLAATQYILDEYENEFNAAKEAKRLPEDEDISMKYCSLRTRLDYGWAKYGNMLLLHLKHKLFQNPDERIKDIGSQVTDNIVSNLSDAKAIFLHTIKWHEKVKAYFSETGNTFLYLSMRYNIALTYKYLECFEPDRSMRIKMHKRRVQMLKDILVLTKPYKELLLLYMYTDMFISCGTVIDMMMENAEIAGKPFTEIKTEVLEYVKNCVQCWEKYYAELTCLKTD